MDNSQNATSGGSAQNSTPNMSTASNKLLMGILAYLGILVIIPFIMAKENPSVKFHIKQGLVLLVIEAVIWVLGMFVSPLWMIFSLVNLATLILSIIGIVNVVNGQEKELPVVGKYSSYFKF